jgi:hypothetical protein
MAYGEMRKGKESHSCVDCVEIWNSLWSTEEKLVEGSRNRFLVGRVAEGDSVQQAGVAPESNKRVIADGL